MNGFEPTLEELLGTGAGSTLPPESTSGGTVAMPLPDRGPVDITALMDGRGLNGGSGGNGGAMAPAPTGATPTGTTEDLVRSLLATPDPPMPTPKPGAGAARVAAVIADALSAFTGRGGNLVATMDARTKLDLEQQIEQRKAAIEGKKLVLDTLKTYDQLQGSQFTRAKDTIATIAEFMKQSPGASSEERMAAVKQLGGALGGLIPTNVLEAMAKDVDFATLAGDLLPFITSPHELGLAMSTAGAMLRAGKTSQEVRDAIERGSAPAVASELFSRLPGAVATVRKLKGLDDKAAVSFDDALAVIEADKAKGPAMGALLRGDRFAKDQRQPILDLLARYGVEAPGMKRETTEAQAKAAATEAGTLAAKTTPAAIAGQAALTAATETARQTAAQPFEMPKLEPATLAVLGEQKIDPRAATTTQIQEARKEGQKRALQFERQKDEMKALIDAGKPLTANQTADLRMAYHREARNVVLSTEPGGLLGAVEKMEPAQQKALEDRIDLKARAMAAGDGFPSLFPSTKGAATATNPTAPAGLPDSKTYKGKTIRDTQTGRRYRSNGVTWTEVK